MWKMETPTSQAKRQGQISEPHALMFDAFEGVQNLCVDLRITEDKKISVKITEAKHRFPLSPI